MLNYATLGIPHAGMLWPVNRAVSLGPPQTPTLRGANQIFNRGQPFTQTLPVTTNAGDCIIITFWANGATSTPTASGAGATWTTYEQSDHQAGLMVGYNCSAGQTTVTVTAPGGIGPPGGVPGLNLSVSVWSGVRSASNPVIGTPNMTQASGGVVTSGSVSFSNLQLVLGASVVENQQRALGIGGVIWSSGATNNRTITTGAQYVVQDYFVASSSSSSTLTEDSSGGVDTISIVLAVLHNAP